MEKYFNTHEVARMCQVTRGSVIRWIHEGKLAAAVTAGGHHRVRAVDLHQLLMNLKMVVPLELENLFQKTRPSHILIVDDDPNIRTMLRKFLEKFFPDHLISEAMDGFEAGLLVQNLKPELLLLDLMLPGIDGFRICKRIRSQKELDQVKIVVITGLQDEKTKETLLKLGADDFLTKPFNLRLLEVTIRKHLQNPAAKQDLPAEVGKRAAA